MGKLGVRRCNGDWAYCEGDCEGCYQNKTNASNVVVVVRCRDCVYRSGNYCHCDRYGIVQSGTFTEPEDYCSYGKKRNKKVSE